MDFLLFFIFHVNNNNNNDDDVELMLASFECEEPTTAEKELYDIT